MRSQPCSCSAAMRGAMAGIGVAHGPVDDDALARQRRAASFSACERVMVLSGPSSRSRVPDLGVVLALAAGADGQDDQVEDRPPFPARLLDHAPVGEELLQIAPHRPVAGAVGRAEVEQQRRRLRPRLAPADWPARTGSDARRARLSVRSRERHPVSASPSPGPADADIGEAALRPSPRAGRCCAGRRRRGA